jgi:hypothetical protein
MTFQVGDEVEKVRGLPLAWEDRCDLHDAGRCEQRVVVECTVPEVAGALHIYSPDQIRLKASA